MGTKATLTPKEKHLLGNYILAHCTIPDGERYAKWDTESGGNDQAVVDKLRLQIPHLTVSHVRYMRQKFDLAIEPPRLIFQRPRENYSMTELDELRDKIEALIAHVKTYDVRIKDFEQRIHALEDKYTAPKPSAHVPSMVTGGPDAVDYKLIERSSERAVAEVIDPLLAGTSLGSMRPYRKGKHSR